MHLSPILRHLRNVTILIPILVLTGCFGEGDGPQKILATPVPPTTGIFVDSPVSGAAWQTSGGESGLTNDLGEFNYVPGEIVTFSVGGIVLGSAKGAPIVSAVELTGSNNPTDKAAVNQFVFLQSIDEDQNPDNGISISGSTTGAAAGLTLDFFDPDFANALAAVVATIAPGNTIVSDIDALAHFYSTYAALGGSDAFSFSFPGFPPVRSGVTYELVFADEFNTGTVPNPDVWNYDLGYGPDNFGWGNNEWQLYTDSTDNVRVEDGNLVIQARCDTPPCGVRNDTVTSGRINTVDKFEFRYGTVIARIKPPVGDGAWPAFWSLGANFPEIGWPRSGEIDFLEMHNAFPTTSERSTHFTMHWCDDTIQTDPAALCFPQSEGWKFFTQQRDFATSLGDDFHLFEADWDQNRIIGRIDGITYFERVIEPGTMEEFLREFFLILNVAMGGTLGSDNQPPNGNEVWPQTMLVDYVRVYQRTDAPTRQLFIDFEDAPATYNFNDFEGGVGNVVTNPAQEGINTSAQVGRMQKFAATSMATFGGSTLVTAFDVPANSAFTMKVWSSRPVDVTFKLEGSPAAEVVASHGGGSMWQELRFDFGDFTTTATGITLIFDNGVLGDAGGDAAAWTFYFDDIGRVDILSQIDLPITFDDAGVDYTLTDFGDPVAAVTTLVADPDDADNTVASTTKPAQAPVWAGTTMSTTSGLASPIPFTASETTIGVRVYSPAAGIPVRLKADNVVNGDVSVETELLTSVANAWQTLVFDFSDQVQGTAALDPNTSYTALSIFFDFGTGGNGATYLWDDVEFGVSLPDTTAPTLLDVSISSSNSITSLAKAGDEVTVELTADESIAAPTVSIGGVAAEVDGGGASWVASRTLTEADADGLVSFSVEFADLAGNAGVPVSDTTNSSSVTFDATAPTLSILGAPMGPQTTLDPIVLTFQFSEPVTGFTLSDIQRMNGSASLFTVIDGANYTTRFAPNGLGDLSVAVAAGAAADAAGNPNEVAVSVTVDIELDADAPLLTAVSISSSGNAGFARVDDTVTIEMTANEDIAEPVVTIAGVAAEMIDGGGATWTASRVMRDTDIDGEIGFLINFEDTDGNAGPTTTGTTDDTVVVFDATAPTLMITGVPDPVQTIDAFTVTFEFNEDVTGFDVGGIDVVSGGADDFAIVDARTYTAGITPDGNGDLTISVAADAATDLAGNGNAAASVGATIDLSPFWDVVWSDEFTGTSLNALNWTRRTDADCIDDIPCTGLQSYRTDRVSVGADRLTIEARDDVARGGPTYTSGLIDTRGRQEMKHGRIEIDVKLPAGAAGIRPSLWMLPVNAEYGAWPQSGAIDITNAPNGVPLEHSLRYGLPEPEDTTATGTSVVPGTATTQFLTYALEWEAGEIRWFVDGIHVATQIPANWYAYFENEDGVFTSGTGSAPFDQDFYLLLSLAVDADGGTYPQTMQVEAVRVFRCANAVDLDAGTGCAGLADPVLDLEPVVVNAPFNGAPFIDALEVYETGPAMLDFVDDQGAMTQGTLVPATSGAVTSNTAADDMGNTVWNVVINGVGGVVMGPADLAPATAFFDLSGGETAGELLFRMRVNSVTNNPQLKVGFDSDAGSGTQQLTFAADGTWRNYSVKIATLLDNSVIAGTSLDLANIVNLFTLEAAGGTVDLDLDDISVKVACRVESNCESTARFSQAPPDMVYAQDFELPGIDIDDTAALTNDGWVIFGNVFDSGMNFLFGYGVFGAPNDPPPDGNSFFSAIVSGQGGNDQGGQQLSIFNDYNCCQPSNGHFNGTDRVEALVFQELTLTADDVGRTYTFSFDAKADTSANGLGGASTALGSLKTLNPAAGFAQTNFVPVDMTSIPDTWNRYEVSLEIDAGLVGQLLQFGFSSTAGNFEPSNVYYDNVLVTRTGQ